jgi:predicted ATPase
MKIKEITLQNYKRFVEPKTISFCDEDGDVNDMTLLVGDNGSGKSSVLQAIALLAGSSRSDFRPSGLNYPGFNWETIQNGRMPVKVQGTFLFNTAEINATVDYTKRLQEMHPSNQYYIPTQKTSIVLELDYLGDKIKSDTLKSFRQMFGYQYALQLQHQTERFQELFKDVGFCLWYHEQRTASSISTEISDGNGGFKKFEIEEIRQVLSSWNRFHNDKTRFNWELKAGQRDFYEILENNYKALFPNRSFKGILPVMDPRKLLAQPHFILSDGQGEYEISEMSAGERVIFPILIDFANWNINNSIIIIDELELHLHPPLQQALVDLLPRLGKNNQFIITTHSEDVAAMFHRKDIRYL